MSHDGEREAASTITTEIELEPLPAAKLTGRMMLGSVLPFLGSVKVRVVVQVGCAEISVAELAKLQQGEVLALDRAVDEPLDVLVNGHVVARGVLVAVGEHFGVRITETVIAAASTGTR